MCLGYDMLGTSLRGHIAVSAVHSEWTSTPVSPQLPWATEALMEVPPSAGKGPLWGGLSRPQQTSLCPSAHEHDQGFHPSGQVLKFFLLFSISLRPPFTRNPCPGVTGQGGVIVESSHYLWVNWFPVHQFPQQATFPFPWATGSQDCRYIGSHGELNRFLPWVPHPGQGSQLLGGGPGFRRFSASQGILIRS